MFALWRASTLCEVMMQIPPRGVTALTVGENVHEYKCYRQSYGVFTYVYIILLDLIIVWVFLNHNVSEVGSNSVFRWPVGEQKPTLSSPPWILQYFNCT
jgi:hypothetical protein